ncbi:MAG TPA: PfkB family carbohydrate kinase [Candidatus Limnocylindrales bacterium]|jgi:sugar/nucleoside kinase (ribokinase family)|nr:PfkB family carbohydrate kinase [Candidatus Limnocylindrales bacterium]
MARLAVPARRPRRFVPRIVVLGDLLLDVVLAPEGELIPGTDVAGRVTLRQGGSAANTARWLARLGARTTLISAVGRDPAGRALFDAVRADGVVAHVNRVAGERTGRIGVVVAPSGERSFVADRGAADRLASDDLEASWFDRVSLLHVPAYSLIGEPVGSAARRAIELARAAGGQVSLDLASIGPLLARGRRAALDLVGDVAPDLLFATAAEAEAIVGRYRPEALLELARVAVVKRGAKGATVLALENGTRLRFEVATERLRAPDTTGAGDAFDAGFIVDWLASRAAGRSLPAALQRAALAGHRAAARHLSTPPTQLPLL